MPDYQVANAAQAKLLLDVELHPLLILLMARPHSISEVAQHLQVDVQRAYYLVKKLERGKVACVVRVQPRRGPAVKHYAVPTLWFIPFAETRAETFQALGVSQMIPRFERLIHNAAQVVLEHAGKRPGFWMNASSLVVGDEQGPTAEQWRGEEPTHLDMRHLALSRERANDFKQRLSLLVEEFARDSGASGDSVYTFAVMLVRGQVD